MAVALGNAQIGRGERAEKMRTYNFPQDRLTDKRLGHNLSNLPRRLDGELDDLIEALMQSDEAERLASLEEGEEGGPTTWSTTRAPPSRWPTMPRRSPRACSA